MEARLNAWLDRVREEAGETNLLGGLLLERMRTRIAREQTRTVHVRTEAEAAEEPALSQVRAEAGPDGTETQADADEGLAARERQWRTDAARAQEAAVHEARATAETEAAARLAAEQARWVDEAKQAIAAATKQARADADEGLAARERVLAPFAVDQAACFRADEQRVDSSAVSGSVTKTTT